MSNRVKVALFFGVGLTFVLGIMNLLNIIREGVNTSSEIIRSFGAVLSACISVSLLSYFFIGESKAKRIIEELKGSKDHNNPS